MLALPGPLTYNLDCTAPDVWEARCAELGIASFGSTLEEAEQMIHEAVALWLEEVDEEELARTYSRERTIIRTIAPHEIAA